ncbi:MAG: hypothetical protein GWP17_06085 [Aquificales bacterium]|nr:hypothetical protein [Aquificales bacterium]
MSKICAVTANSSHQSVRYRRKIARHGFWLSRENLGGVHMGTKRVYGRITAVTVVVIHRQTRVVCLR